ncbi:OmpH family outer membrane protein [Sneathiella sp.]|uniref:OmpH family outer membrane protein n=1 Tax=Sneathiella sp. TaxID=1964365 RepID=UPI003569FDA0
MVKKIQAFAVALCIFGLAQSANLAVTQEAEAQSKIPEAVVAVVDINHILQVSEPSKNAEEEVKTLLKSRVDGLNERGNALKGQKAELDKQRAIISPDAYQKKLSQLNIDRQNLQREFQVINAKLNDVLVGVRLRLRDIIIRIAADVSKEKGINIGIDRAKTVFFDNKMDITDEVLAKFNKANPKVDITVEEKGDGKTPVPPKKKE